MAARRPFKPNKVYSRLAEISAELPKLVDDALKEGAELVAADAERRLEPHRLSGALEGQIYVDDKKRAGIYVRAGDPKDPSFAFYGHLIEFGTSHSPPFPFLVPALEENAGTVERLARVAIGRLGDASASVRVKDRL